MVNFIADSFMSPHDHSHLFLSCRLLEGKSDNIYQHKLSNRYFMTEHDQTFIDWIYLKALETTLSEWLSEEDGKAYSDLAYPLLP